jgi:hypothetical protein
LYPVHQRSGPLEAIPPSRLALMVLAVTLTSGNPVAAGTGGLWFEDVGALGGGWAIVS